MEVNMAAPVAVTAAIASAAKWSARSRRHCGNRAVGDHPDRAGAAAAAPTPPVIPKVCLGPPQRPSERAAAPFVPNSQRFERLARTS